MADVLYEQKYLTKTLTLYYFDDEHNNSGKSSYALEISDDRSPVGLSEVLLDLNGFGIFRTNGQSILNRKFIAESTYKTSITFEDNNFDTKKTLISFNNSLFDKRQDLHFATLTVDVPILMFLTALKIMSKHSNEKRALATTKIMRDRLSDAAGYNFQEGLGDPLSHLVAQYAGIKRKRSL